MLSLRGNEGLMLDLGGLRKHWNPKRKDYLTIVLYGKLKGENSYREHLIPCCNKTKSGINVKAIIKRALECKEEEGLVSGPLISDSSGDLYSSKGLDNMLQEILIELYESHDHHFPLPSRQQKISRIITNVSELSEDLLTPELKKKRWNLTT